MVNWLEPCSCRRARRADGPRPVRVILLLACTLATGCGRAADPPDAAVAPPPAAPPASAKLLCAPADVGSLQARLSGAIEAEIDWSASREPQCRGDVRPTGDGLRLVFRGVLPDEGPLLVLLGAGPLQPGVSARNVPVNLTLVREGSGEFFATQGDDKCAFDELRQSPVDGSTTSFLVEGRGFCTQPARGMGAEGAVLVTRFDVTAIVDAQGDDEDSQTAGPP
jgi:hypothetical protein